MWQGEDRRRNARVKYPCLITVRKKSPPSFSILTHTEDIGKGGVHVIVDKKLDAMSEIELEIDLLDTLPNVFSKGTIRWVKESSPQNTPADAKGGGLSKGTVDWVKEIAPADKDGPVRYNIGIKFTFIKDVDKFRIDNIVNSFLGKS